MRCRFAVVVLIGCYAPDGAPAPDAAVALDGTSGGDAPDTCLGVADGLPCAGGLCYDGTCCTGCWDGSECEEGTDASACGRQGEACVTCSGACECDVAVCPGGDIFRRAGCSAGGCGLESLVDCCDLSDDGICSAEIPCEPWGGCVL